jgi:hypothetical protein
MKRKTIILFGILGTMAVIGAWGIPRLRDWLKFRPDAGREDHSTYHDCQWNRDAIIEPAKQELVEAKGMPLGSPVPLQDLIPFITNTKHYASTRYPGTPPDYLPKCPSGGQYAINPIGSNVVCSHPYHQWYNCMWKQDKH